ncbi:MAG TPA: 6-phosphogluconolactonase [Patescibacteria group bacterium]|nr:6-phosphogluconolactonase [Patescibacteria group bacterium]
MSGSTHNRAAGGRTEEIVKAMESGATVGHVSDLLVVADGAALAQEATRRVVAIAEEAVARCGRFTVALAGGSTPKRLYSLLAAEPYCTRLSWREIHLFWGDERAVPAEHPDSNFGMARATLLSRVPIPLDRIHRMQAERADLDAAANEYEAEIARTFAAQSPGEPPAFDLVLLGLGTDGHTASLFPYTRALRETRRWVAPNYIPELKAHRLTLTASILNRAILILFLVSGVEKAAALQAVLEGPLDPERLPAQLIRPVAGRLVWLVDQAAASRLGKKVP